MLKPSLEETGELQQRRFFSLGYRKAAAFAFGAARAGYTPERVRRLMRESGLLSRVRRKKCSEEACATRRPAKVMKAPDLVGRAPLLLFVAEASVPLDACPLCSGRRCAIVQDRAPCLEGTLYLNSLSDLHNGEIVAYEA